MVEEYDCPIFTNATLLDVKTMRKMHLMSYNIHKGMNIGNRKSVLSGLRQYIRYAKADVVFLQEVAGDARHDIDVSQFEYLADSVWHHYAYGKNAVYDNRHHGNAILSKAPIVEWKNINISTNRFEHRVGVRPTKTTGFDLPVCSNVCSRALTVNCRRRYE